jgi:hypothetical protein
MSYASILQTLPESWRSSGGLAALASLGVHGLLFIVLPLVSLDSQDVQLHRTVGIVELTPEEQSRLPQYPQQTLPSPAADQSELPPLPSSQAFQSDVLPPLPAPPSFLPPPPPNSTSIYQYPISNSLPPPQIPTVPVPLPPPPENQSLISQPPLGVPQQLSPLPPNAIPPNPNNLPNINGLKPSEPFAPTQQNINPQNNNQTQSKVAVNNQANRQIQPPAPATLPERTKQELIARRNAIRRERLATSRITPNSQSSQRYAALQQRLRRASERTTSNSNSNTIQRYTALQQRLRQSTASTPSTSNSSRTQRFAALQQRLRQSTASTSSNRVSSETAQTIAQVETYQDRQQQLQQAYPNLETKAPIRDKIKTCDKQLDGGVAILAAVVSPEGKIVSGPDLISKNSGAAIRQAALAYVKRYRFSKTNSRSNQPFRLDFKYDSASCPVNTKPPVPNNTRSQKPQ